ncbi:MAG TPA: PEP-CTERM sorting domain-containing protein [Tepidisphaeraceae bacterium]|jgi:hypothetical protein|nr:PEP-CTERM sorting domain-containing protein [Tepidisphaeraceae bacterium]
MSISSNSKRNVALAGACLGGIAFAIPQSSQAALLSNVVFNDVLATNGSTINSAAQSYVSPTNPDPATPTATSTNYDVASSKNATTSSLTSGSPLQLTIPSTSSGVSEVQALFTSTPLPLINVGDAIELTVTFTDNTGLNINSSSSVDIGLYNSGGSAPYSNLQNGTATSPSTVTGINNSGAGLPNDNTGGVAGWLGYETDAFGASKPKIYTRPAQSGSNNVAQALVSATTTGGVENANGTQSTYTSQSSASDPLTAGNVYTDEFSITLSSPGIYTLTQSLYSGATDTGSIVNGGTSTSGPLSVLTSAGFDGLAVGFRESDSVAGEMDISQVEVTTNVAVPEPATIGILSLAGLGLMRRRRRT